MPRGFWSLADNLGLNMVLKYENQAGEPDTTESQIRAARRAISPEEKCWRIGEARAGQRRGGFYEYLPEARKSCL